MTAGLNRLWKLLRLASPDLYLALGGGHPEVELPEKALQTQGVLTLLSQKPDLGQWKDLSAEQLLEAMGGGKYKGREKLIEQLRTLAGSFPTVSPAMALLIRTAAQHVQHLKAEQTEIIRMLEALTAENMAVHALKQIPGIATLTASTLAAEIIDVRRFPREDSLACYSGLGMKEHSTGDNFRMVRTQLFNHRLKDAFMTVARNFVQYNPESHLAGYHRNLLKRGMSPTEATKRVARALVRVIHRQLSAVVAQDTGGPTATQKEEGEGDMASGWIRSDQSHTSNISPSSLTNTKDRGTKKVKGLPTQTGGAEVGGKQLQEEPLGISKTISSAMLAMPFDRLRPCSLHKSSAWLRCFGFKCPALPLRPLDSWPRSSIAPEQALPASCGPVPSSAASPHLPLSSWQTRFVTCPVRRV